MKIKDKRAAHNPEVMKRADEATKETEQRVSNIRAARRSVDAWQDGQLTARQLMEETDATGRPIPGTQAAEILRD